MEANEGVGYNLEEENVVPPAEPPGSWHVTFREQR